MIGGEKNDCIDYFWYYRGGGVRRVCKSFRLIGALRNEKQVYLLYLLWKGECCQK